MNLELFLLVAILAIAVATDILYGKIHNVLTIPAMACGLMYHVYVKGFEGFLFSFEGLLIGFGVLIFFYAFGMMGAGDVKLMAAIGSFLGPAGVFNAFLFTAFSGGVYALIVLALHGRLINFLKHIFYTFKIFLMRGGLELQQNERKPTPKLCYGIAIAVGTTLSIFSDLKIV